jgi:hypothetical protein
MRTAKGSIPLDYIFFFWRFSMSVCSPRLRRGLAPAPPPQQLPCPHPLFDDHSELAAPVSSAFLGLNLSPHPNLNSVARARIMSAIPPIPANSDAVGGIGPRIRTTGFTQLISNDQAKRVLRASPVRVCKLLQESQASIPRSQRSLPICMSDSRNNPDDVRAMAEDTVYVSSECNIRGSYDVVTIRDPVALHTLIASRTRSTATRPRACEKASPC